MPTHLNGSNGRRGRSGNRRHGSNSPDRQEITPELIRQVADRVYQLWLEDLRLERERYRPGGGQARSFRRGGF